MSGMAAILRLLEREQLPVPLESLAQKNNWIEINKLGIRPEACIGAFDVSRKWAAILSVLSARTGVWNLVASWRHRRSSMGTLTPSYKLP